MVSTALAAAAMLGGCANLDEQGNAALGGAVGGAAGAVIGHEAGGSQGAVIGAGAGAATGAVIGQKRTPGAQPTGGEYGTVQRRSHERDDDDDRRRHRKHDDD